MKILILYSPTRIHASMVGHKRISSEFIQWMSSLSNVDRIALHSRIVVGWQVGWLRIGQSKTRTNISMIHSSAGKCAVSGLMKQKSNEMSSSRMETTAVLIQGRKRTHTSSSDTIWLRAIRASDNCKNRLTNSRACEKSEQHESQLENWKYAVHGLALTREASMSDMIPARSPIDSSSSRQRKFLKKTLPSVRNWNSRSSMSFGSGDVGSNGPTSK